MPNKSKTKIYYVWVAMRQRCYNRKAKDYKYYGGRGIKVCSRWMSFDNFTKDMGPRPYGLTLDRINNNGNYCKSNCRWASRLVQQKNRRSFLDEKTRENNVSGQNGVCWNVRYKGWYVSFRKKYLGISHSLEDAINIRRDAEKQYKLKKEIL